MNDYQYAVEEYAKHYVALYGEAKALELCKTHRSTRVSPFRVSVFPEVTYQFWTSVITFIESA